MKQKLSFGDFDNEEEENIEESTYFVFIYNEEL